MIKAMESKIMKVLNSIILGLLVVLCGCASKEGETVQDPLGAEDYESEFMNALADEETLGEVDEVTPWTIDSADETQQPGIEEQDVTSFKLDEAVADANSAIPEVEDVSHQHLWEETPVADHNDRPIQEELNNTDFESVSLEDSSSPASSLASPLYAPTVSSDLDGEYKVKKGETLREIAIALFGSVRFVNQIVADNDIANPNLIRAGQTLRYNSADTKAGSRLAADGTIRVQKGDTLSSLAKKLLGNATAWEQIWQLNTDLVQNPDRIRVGQVLRVR
jgi:nucleoid-associated protein YgaU